LIVNLNNEVDKELTLNHYLTEYINF